MKKRDGTMCSGSLIASDLRKAGSSLRATSERMGLFAYFAHSKSAPPGSGRGSATFGRRKIASVLSGFLLDEVTSTTYPSDSPRAHNSSGLKLVCGSLSGND